MGEGISSVVVCAMSARPLAIEPHIDFEPGHPAGEVACKPKT